MKYREIKKTGDKVSLMGVGAMRLPKNPDGSVVCVVLNRNEKEMPLTLNLNGKMVETVSEARSIATYIFSE